MLMSAKANLEKTAFFGITGHQVRNQQLFESTFHLRFKKTFEQIGDDNVITNTTVLGNLTEDDVKRIKQLNHLDIELFEFAKQLFDKRYSQAKMSAQ